jgi:hypothetical protein
MESFSVAGKAVSEAGKAVPVTEEFFRHLGKLSR